MPLRADSVPCPGRKPIPCPVRRAEAGVRGPLSLKPDRRFDRERGKASECPRNLRPHHHRAPPAGRSRADSARSENGAAGAVRLMRIGLRFRRTTLNQAESGRQSARAADWLFLNFSLRPRGCLSLKWSWTDGWADTNFRSDSKLRKFPIARPLRLKGR